MSSTPGDWSAMALPSGARSGYREGSMDSLPFTGAGRSTTRAGSTHRRQPGTNAPPPTAAPETARVLSKNPLLEVATLPLPRHGKVRIEDHLVLHPDEHQRGTLHPEGVEADRERARDAQMIRVSEGQGCVDGLLLLDPVEGEQPCSDTFSVAGNFCGSESPLETPLNSTSFVTFVARPWGEGWGCFLRAFFLDRCEEAAGASSARASAGMDDAIKRQARARFTGGLPGRSNRQWSARPWKTAAPPPACGSRSRCRSLRAWRRDSSGK